MRAAEAEEIVASDIRDLDRSDVFEEAMASFDEQVTRIPTFICSKSALLVTYTVIQTILPGRKVLGTLFETVDSDPRIQIISKATRMSC